jgi:hypothetical protein
LDSTAGKKEAGATSAMGGMAGLHSSGDTGDRSELGSGGQGITVGSPEARGRIGELIPSLTGGWVAARRPGDETAWWWSPVLGGAGASSSRRSLEWSGEGERDVENLPRWLMEHGTHQSVGRGGRGKIGREVAGGSSWKRGKRMKE